MNCCICQFTVRNPKNIHEETVGKPPILISDLLLQCTKGTSYQLNELNSTICKKCSEKLSRYHKSLQVARKLRQEILELIRSPFIIKDLKATPPKNDVKFDSSMEKAYELVETVDLSDLDEGDDMAHLEETVETEHETQLINKHINSDSEVEADAEAEVEEAEGEEGFQAVDLDLDIENEIIINEETAEADVKEDHLEMYSEDKDVLSDFEDQMDDTIEYLMSDAEDQDSSADYKVNIQCPSCPEQFTSRRPYNAHTKREHFPGYVCDQCGKTLQSYSGFIGHLQNHEPVKQFECPHCGERFSRKFRLKHHMAWHTGETPYQCEICSKRFVHKVALYKHKMIHDNESKRLECQVCGFKTRTKAHLERHTRSHTGAKPFACPVCNKRFSQMYNMKAHLREHESPGTNRHRRFHCPKCTHTFINEQNYLTHCKQNDCTPV